MTGLHSGKILKDKSMSLSSIIYSHLCLLKPVWLTFFSETKNRSFMECSSCSFLNVKLMVNSKIFNLYFSPFLTQTIIWLKKTWHVVHKLYGPLMVFLVLFEAFLFLWWQSWIFSVTWPFRNHSNMLICCSRNIYCFHQCLKQFIFLKTGLIFLWKP